MALLLLKIHGYDRLNLILVLMAVLHVISLLPSTTAIKASQYAGLEVLQVWPKSNKDVQYLKRLSRQLHLDTSQHFVIPVFEVNKSCVFVEFQDKIKRLQRALRKREIKTKKGDPGSSIQEFVRKIDAACEKRSRFEKGMSTSQFTTNEYHNLTEINLLLFAIANEYRELVTLRQLTKSYENRSVYLLKVGFPVKRGVVKKNVIIESGIHAREWISPAATIFVILKLLQESSQPNTIKLLKDYDIYFVPILNVDGYEYTWTDERFWRKTRSVVPGCENLCGFDDSENSTWTPTKCELCCKGVDANRNWDYLWDTYIPHDTSTHPCMDTYRGHEPFSEPETYAMAEFTKRMANTTTIYLSVHAFGQMFLYPYSVIKKTPENASMLMALSLAATMAMKNVGNATYSFGAAHKIMYMAAGTSIDWVKGVVDIPYVFAIELRPENDGGGLYRLFHLPPEQIEVTGKELLAAINTLITLTHNVDYSRKKPPISAQPKAPPTNGYANHLAPVIKSSERTESTGVSLNLCPVGVRPNVVHSAFVIILVFSFSFY